MKCLGDFSEALFVLIWHESGNKYIYSHKTVYKHTVSL